MCGGIVRSPHNDTVVGQRNAVRILTGACIHPSTCKEAINTYRFKLKLFYTITIDTRQLTNDIHLCGSCASIPSSISDHTRVISSIM